MGRHFTGLIDSSQQNFTRQSVRMDGAAWLQN